MHYTDDAAKVFISLEKKEEWEERKSKEHADMENHHPFGVETHFNCNRISHPQLCCFQFLMVVS